MVNTATGSAFEFQSTLSVRRATGRNDIGTTPQMISIHALRKESDAAALAVRHHVHDFNPRSP